MSAEAAMTLEEDLPPGWSWAALGDICVPVTQIVPSDLFEDQFTYLDISSIDNQSYSLTDTKQLGVTEAPSRARQLVLSGDTLFSTVRTYLKNIAYVDERFDGKIASPGFCVLRAIDGITGRYIFYYVVTTDFIDKISTLQRGVSYPAVRDGDVRAQPIPVAPTNEQTRIVEKIDELFSQIEAGEQALARAQKLLERYRQSVLNAAVTGELTREWREQHKGEIESGEALLRRILQARREAWEQAERAKMHDRDRPPTDDRWKQNYKEPEPPDTTDLRALPEGWTWVSLDQLVSGQPLSLQSGPFGSNLKHSEFRQKGILVIGIDNVLNGRFSTGKQNRISRQKYVALSKYSARPGDLLVTVMASLGRSCVVPRNLEPAIVTKHVYRITMEQEFVVPEYVNLTLQADGETRRLMLANAQGQTRPGLNSAILRVLPIPLPPTAEQNEISARVLEHTPGVDGLLGALKTESRRCLATRQSILTAAFSGKLVPQDPTDEAASVLLERIREERIAVAQDARRKRPKGHRRPWKKGELVMVKTRKEIKATHLRDIIRASNGEMAADALWKASELDIDDFYKQLREEVAAGHLHEERAAQPSRIVCR